MPRTPWHITSSAAQARFPCRNRRRYTHGERQLWGDLIEASTDGLWPIADRRGSVVSHSRLSVWHPGSPAFATAQRLRTECGPGWPAALPVPLCGGESGSTGRVAGVDGDVGSFSLGQESGRNARPRLTDLPPMAKAWMPELRQRRSGCPMGGKRQAGWPFSLAIFLFTPGILPYALRASFAVRARILRARGHAKRK